MKERVTLGQRIQEGRRAAGLSQEALGEQLQVSRQAVSKWESDAAIPELENLIAMSRIFGMSIGELLGVEAPAPAEDLAGEALTAAEAIAGKYAEAHRRQTAKLLRERTVAFLVGLGLLAAVLAVHIYVSSQQLAALQSQFLSLASRPNVVTALPQTQDSRLAASEISIPSLDLAGETLTLDLAVTPVEQTVGTTAVFTATLADGTVLTREAQTGEAGFTAQNWTVPLSDDIDLAVIFTSGQDVRTVPMETIAGRDSFLFQVNGTWNSSWQGSGPTVELGEMRVQITAYDQPYMLAQPLALEQADLCLYRGWETEPEQVLPLEDAGELWESAGELDLMAPVGYRTSFQIQEGETVVSALRLLDNYGRTTYYLLNGWTHTGGQIQLQSLHRTGWTPGDPVA